jgi:hypothetical protein
MDDSRDDSRKTLTQDWLASVAIIPLETLPKPHPTR